MVSEDFNTQHAQILEDFKQFEDFSRVVFDGFVLIDRSGKVLKCNQQFCIDSGKKSKQVLRSDSLFGFMRFWIEDREIRIEDVLDPSGPTRIDQVRVETDQIDGHKTAIVGFHRFLDHQGQVLGAFVLIRDVTADNHIQAIYKTAQNQSRLDPLTGLYTRAYFEESLKRLEAGFYVGSENEGSKFLSIALLDIDFFKLVNDVHGHQAGDYVLKEVSEIIQESFRKSDICGRYGGEEFLVILPSTNLHGAQVAVEKFRAAVEGRFIEFEGTHIPCTVSCGIAELKVGEEKHDKTISRADAALYFSKENGRNRVSIHDGQECRVFSSGKSIQHSKKAS